MSESEDKTEKPGEPPRREIGNANLFADDIIFSDTEKILFEEDLQENAPSHREGLMDGNPERRYTANKKLNEGGMKAIWEVDDHRTARKVAMALIQDSKIASEQDIDSFLYEARLTANLQHPNIIPIYDIALDENGNPYFTMKSLKGKTLGEILNQLKNNDSDVRKQYTTTTLLSIFSKVCDAISYAHAKGVIHLDLKPSNVIVGEFGDVHVLDWGLSTLITHLNDYEGESVSWHSMDDVALENGQTLTRYLEGSAKSRERRNIVGGTPGYMSPEQAQGSPANINFQTDVYMLGAMLYEILTYCCPLVGDTVKEVLQKTVRGDVPTPGTRVPQLKIPTALSAIAMKAMQTDPSERYPTVNALLTDVQKYQDGFATSAENPTFTTHVFLLIKRHKMAVSLIAASGLLIAGILVQSFSKIKDSERIAVGARNLATERLEELQLKNTYIEDTAKQVAPDYLNLMAREEKDYEFAASESALDTSLAFDPSQQQGWLWKAKILMGQQQFSEALKILSGRHGHPVRFDSAAIKLADQYASQSPVPDSLIPEMVRDFKTYNLEGGIPRLFYHFNQGPIQQPDTHFAAIEASLKALNPNVEPLNFSWEPAQDGGWIIDISNNPDLNNIAPLCGLNLSRLNANGIGTPDIKLLTENGMKSLQLADTELNHLFELDQFAGLQELNISGTRIRNLINIVKYPQLTSLDLSNIQGLAISPQLIWCQNLRTLTVAEEHKNNPTLRMLANRGVIMIYTDQ